MRHREGGFKLQRDPSARRALLRVLATNVIERDRVITTVTKAKAVQPMVEKIITLAKKGDLASRRRVIARLGADRMAFDWLYLPKDVRPPEAYAQWASSTVLRETYLTFAKWTSAVAITLWALALAFSLVGT